LVGTERVLHCIKPMQRQANKTKVTLLDIMHLLHSCFLS
jgi:hypothetical protein